MRKSFTQQILTVMICVLALAAGAAGAAQEQQTEATGRQRREGEFGREVLLEGMSDTAARDVYRLALRETELNMGYRRHREGLRGGTGHLTEHRWLARQDDDGQELVLLVGLMLPATRHPRLYLWGQTGPDEEPATNPDVEILAEAVGEMEAEQEVAREFTHAELTHEVYQLTSVDMSSAMQNLAKLGFNTQPPSAPVSINELPAVFAIDQAEVGSIVGQRRLDATTITSPEERLLILYHPSQTLEVAALKSVLEDTIDVKARQVLIEGMIIELTDDDFRELGVEWEWFGRQWQRATFLAEDHVDRTRFPFIYTYDPEFTPPEDLADRVRASLRMVIAEGKAELLSSPSVLVLDNRNAQVEVIREVPIIETVVHERTTEIKVRFETVGVILNIKPRISQEGGTVAMQVLAEVSEAPREEYIIIQDQPMAPTIHRRVISTMARVQDNTPFIIGGLIRTEQSLVVDRLPFLSRIPVLGRLFQRRRDRDDRREVIIVLTPRVLRPGDAERPAMPKDHERFDFLDTELFRHTYRLKAEDIFDLGFLEDNPAILSALERARRLVARRPQYGERSPFREMAAGVIPGEHGVVIRMLYEVVRYKLGVHEDIKDTNLIIFLEDEDTPAGFSVTWLARDILLPASPDGTLEGYFNRPYPKEVPILRFQIPAPDDLEAALDAPVCRIEWIEAHSRTDVEERLLEINHLRDDYRYEEFAFALDSASDMRRMKIALAVREMILINDWADMLRLRDFRVGRRLMVPEFDGPHERVMLVDHDVAEIFYKSNWYYHALRKRLELGHRLLDEALDGERGL